MSSMRVNKRLKRLSESGICSFEKVSEHAINLKALANKCMKVDDSVKRGKFFKALGDATRVRILGLLNAREMCVCEVMVALDLTQPTASHHLKILENVDLVKSRKEGKWVLYTLSNPTQTAFLLKLSNTNS